MATVPHRTDTTCCKTLKGKDLCAFAQSVQALIAEFEGIPEHYLRAYGDDHIYGLHQDVYSSLLSLIGAVRVRRNRLEADAQMLTERAS